MTDHFVQALREWQNFYFMIGSSSATLVGLMFIAVSLGTELPSARDERTVNTFVTPILKQLMSVLVIAAIMLMPTFRNESLGIVLLVVGSALTLYAVNIAWRFFRFPNAQTTTPIQDLLTYAVLPVLGNIFIIFTGAGALSGSTDALNWVAVGVVLLVVVNVINTWDLMMWIAQNRQ